MARATISIRDYSREITTTSLTSTVLTAANFDAQVAAWSTLRTAILGLTLGVMANQSLSQFVLGSSALPANSFAQREMKWLVPYVDSVTGKKFQSEIGTADLGNGHILEGTDLADMTDAEWTAFVAAFEAFAKSPDNPANAVTVEQAYFVGRRT